MAYTTVRRFEHCTHSLFRRYISVCSLLGDAQRARSAWRALERTGHAQMLQDVNMNMVFIDTLLRAARTASTEQYEDHLETAISCAPPPPLTTANTSALHIHYVSDMMLCLYMGRAVVLPVGLAPRKPSVRTRRQHPSRP